MMRHPHPAEEIRWREVSSSNIDRVGWDAHNRMYVRYKKSGDIYMYEDVPRQRAVACVRAHSCGSYVNKKIIPNYQAVKIS
jgi:KTSC domain